MNNPKVGIEYNKVVVCSGHLIDRPNQPPRFPAHKEGLVRHAIAEQLAVWQVGQGDLGICGGSRGADLLFAECCIDCGAQVRLLIALPDNEFMARSVHLPGTDWASRYGTIAQNPQVTKLFLEAELGKAPANLSAFARTNEWMVAMAGAESNPEHLFVIVVWDEQLNVKKPGGTADFVARIQSLNYQYAIINPSKL